LNTEEISKVIKNCSDIERKITRKITVGKLTEKKSDIERKIKEIHMLELNLDSEILYKKVSTSEKIPLWDLEYFHFFENETIVNEVDKIFSQLLDIFDDHEKLTTIINNKKIDDFIEKYSSHLKKIIKIGRYIPDYESLKTTSSYINDLRKVRTYLSENLFK